MDMTALRRYWIALIFVGLNVVAFAQHEHPTPPQTGSHEQPTATEQHPEAGSTTQAAESGHPAGEASHGCGHSMAEVEGEFNAGETAVHHIADANARFWYSRQKAH